MTHAPARLIFDRVDAGQLALRIVAILAGLAAVGSVRLAATESQPVLDLIIVLIIGFSSLFPDSHLGLVVVALVGIDWVLAVDEPATPWTMAVAAAVATFHSALALATIGPIGSRLTRATCRRWVRRTSFVVALVPPTWLAVVVAQRLDLGTNQLLVGAALVAVAVTAMWARQGNLGR